MNITFKSSKLEKLVSKPEKCAKELGKIRSDLLYRRLSDLETASSLEDVRYLPGHYHELIGDRKGQWACDLDQPYRLIFVPHEDPIPTDDSGRSLWIEIKGVEIKEITNYHGK